MNTMKKSGATPSPPVLAKLNEKGKPMVARKIGLMKSADGLERASKPAKVMFQLQLACDSGFVQSK